MMRGYLCHWVYFDDASKDTVSIARIVLAKSEKEATDLVDNDCFSGMEMIDRLYISEVTRSVAVIPDDVIIDLYSAIKGGEASR